MDGSEEEGIVGRSLLVANQTLGGAELEHKVRVRIEAGQREYYVVVPMIEPEQESSWFPDDPAFGVAGQDDRTEDAMQQARERSEHRLRRMIDKIESLGGEADGEVGATDPVDAVKSVLERGTFNEVIVSTLPVGLSRWLKMDLPSRVERMVECPVTTVEAQR